MKLFENKNWEQLRKQYSWVADMHGVPQDVQHHAEGDVAVHTQMVLQQLESLPEFIALDADAQEILWATALLHDVEKRSTTFQEPDGGIVSPGHAKKGAMTARQILMSELNIPFAIREAVVGLVRYHGLPLWIMHKPDPLKALLEASLSVNTAWLSILAKADILGRICQDAAEMLDRISFFEAYCLEQHCFGVPFPFETANARFRYFNTENASPMYVPFEDSICEVTLLSGLPGMGKDHYLQKQLKGLPVISLDSIRREHKLKPEDKSATGWVTQEAKEQARVYLRAKKDFVWNATNITKQMRSQLISLFTDYGARVRIIYLEKPYRTWIKQNAEREHAVPNSVLTKLLGKLEVPTPAEAHEVVYEIGS